MTRSLRENSIDKSVIVFVENIADDFFEYVLERDNADGLGVLHHDRHVLSLILHAPKRVEQLILGLTDQRGSENAPPILISCGGKGHQFFSVDDAFDVEVRIIIADHR